MVERLGPLLVAVKLHYYEKKYKASISLFKTSYFDILIQYTHNILLFSRYHNLNEQVKVITVLVKCSN